MAPQEPDATTTASASRKRDRTLTAMARIRPNIRNEGRLAATGEFTRALDAVAEPFEDLHHAHGNLGMDKIDETRNEQGDSHVANSGVICP